jgi:NADPH-dependent curcumin reductase
MTTNARAWTIAARPDGVPAPSDFRLVERAVPAPGDGEVLLKAHYLALAPVMRSYMLGEPAAGERPLALGDVIHGRGVAEVVASRHPDWRPGDVVHGQIGWQTHKLSRMTPGERFFRMARRGLPAHAGLSALGMTGFSAWCGFVTCGAPKAGDAVLVSGAAGGVGSIVVQIARAMGCAPVVGIAGGAEKCSAVRALGADACIDYKAEGIRARIAALFPRGIDLYFDNVGGEILEAALGNLALSARIVLCGSISEYTRAEPFGPRNYTALRRAEASMRGFFVYNHSADFARAEADLARLIGEGKLRLQQTVLDGFDLMPEGLIGLFIGANTGKMCVAVTPGADMVY